MKRRWIFGVVVALAWLTWNGWAEESPCSEISDGCFQYLEELHLKERGQLGAVYGRDPEGEAFVIVTSLAEESPAMAAGLQVRDALLAIDGRRLYGQPKEAYDESAEFFYPFHLNLTAGQTVKCTVLRDGKVVEVTIVAGPRSIEAARYWILADLTVSRGRNWARAYRDYLSRVPSREATER